MNNNDIFLNYLSENNESSENNERCLISNELLVSNYITLDCNHKFNYLELYNELEQQKAKKTFDNSKLKLNEIKCPYCRNITENILPYFKYYNTKLIKGVNSPPHLSLKLNECQYVEKNSELCRKNACITKFGIFCNNHLKYNIKEEEILFNTSLDIINLYNKKTIKDLRKELQQHNMKLCGNKVDLVNRLIIFYNNMKYNNYIDSNM